MKFTNSITIYHLNDEEITKLQFTNVYCTKIDAVNANTTGDTISNNGIVLIPTTDDLSISVGDYLMHGLIDSDFDINKNNYRITKIKDNRRGNIPHYKLEVEQ